MKKILVAFVIGCMTMVMTSCSSNSPKGVVEQAYKCAKNHDFKGYVDFLDIPEEKSMEKTLFVQMLEEKVAKNPSAIDIKSFEVIDEQVDEETGTAKVTIKVVDSKGEEEETKVDLVKNDKGEWKIKSKK